MSSENFEEGTPEYERNIKLALLAQDHHKKIQHWAAQSVIDIGILAMRSAVLIAGGSVVVGLAFISSVYSSEPELATDLMLAVVAFAASVVTAGAATGFTYLSQHVFAVANTKVEYFWDYPHVRPTDGYDTGGRIGRRWRALTIACIVLSYSLIILGVFIFWVAVSSEYVSD